METVISLRMDCLHCCSDDGIFDARNVCSGRWTDSVIDDHPPDPPFLSLSLHHHSKDHHQQFLEVETFWKSFAEFTRGEDRRWGQAKTGLLSRLIIASIHCDRQHKQQNQGKVWWYLTLFLCRALQGSIHPLPAPSPPSQPCSSLFVLFLLLLHW